MPLLDHFHPPLSQFRHWEGLHSRWISAITDQLNERLPPEYIAEGQTHVSRRFEADIATFDHNDPSHNPLNGVATLPVTQQALEPAMMVVPATLPAAFGVRVVSTREGPELVAAIELLSPGNKDRPENRRLFAIKCLSYIERGIGVIVIDIVTHRQSLHFPELLQLWHPDLTPFPTEPLTAFSYLPVRRNDADQWEIRFKNLHVGQQLPELPLGLAGRDVVMVDLESSYMEARQKQRL